MTPSASDTTAGGDIRPARLSPQDYAQNFCDAHPPLTLAQARIEADRCYSCFDAPCQTAGPTGIVAGAVDAGVAVVRLGLGWIGSSEAITQRKE